MRGHTVAAHGGMAAAVGDMGGGDDRRFHAGTPMPRRKDERPPARASSVATARGEPASTANGGSGASIDPKGYDAGKTIKAGKPYGQSVRAVR